MRPATQPPARRQRHGQAAVFVALILFTLVIFVAMATNIGILVNDKIRMQSTADLATYSVAFHEAQALNKMVEKNREIADVVADCRQQLVTGYWDICDCQYEDFRAEMIIERCKLQLDMKIMQFVQLANYTTSVSPALAAGRNTAKENFSGTEAYTYFFENEYNSPTAMTTYKVIAGLNAGSQIEMPAIGDYENAEIQLNYWRIMQCPVCEGACCPVAMYPVNKNVYSWFYKTNTDAEIWVAGRVRGTPRSQFLDVAYSSGGSDGGYFGASSTSGNDTLHAYAVAKPFEGSMGPTNSPTEKYGWWYYPPALWGPGSAASEMTQKFMMGMVDEYRARMVGINEPLAGKTDPVTLIGGDGTWNTSYFKH